MKSKNKTLSKLSQVRVSRYLLKQVRVLAVMHDKEVRDMLDDIIRVGIKSWEKTH